MLPAVSACVFVACKRLFVAVTHVCCCSGIEQGRASVVARQGYANDLSIYVRSTVLIEAGMRCACAHVIDFVKFDETLFPSSPSPTQNMLMVHSLSDIDKTNATRFSRYAR